MPKQWRLLIIPAILFVATWAIFGAWLWLARPKAELAASWAQVATAFSFAGAGVLAILQIARELQPNVPLLVLVVDDPGSPSEGNHPFRSWGVYLSNSGRVAAEGATVMFSAHGIDRATRMKLEFEGRDFWAPKELTAPYNQGGLPGNWNHIMELTFSRPLAVGAHQVRVATVRWPGEHLTITARCENMAGSRVRWDSQVERPVNRS